MPAVSSGLVLQAWYGVLFAPARLHDAGSPRLPADIEACLDGGALYAGDGLTWISYLSEVSPEGRYYGLAVTESLRTAHGAATEISTTLPGADGKADEWAALLATALHSLGISTAHLTWYCTVML